MPIKEKIVSVYLIIKKTVLGEIEERNNNKKKHLEYNRSFTWKLKRPNQPKVIEDVINEHWCINLII